MKVKVNIEIVDDINTTSDYAEYLHTTKEGIVAMYKDAFEKMLKQTQSDVVDCTVSVEIED